MRYGLLGDIHANLFALDAVLEAMSREGIDRYVHVGDVVGYGAQPAECLARLREIGCDIVCGNHDCAVAGRLDAAYFNPFAREAVEWTRATLSAADIRFLTALPFVRRYDAFVLVHGTLHEPEMFHYLQSIPEAERSLAVLDRPACFVGHSHVPVAFFGGPPGSGGRVPVSYSLDPLVPVDPAGRTIVNIGSVGQPRDDDPRAAYAVYDTDAREVTIKRVAYDVEGAVKSILAAGLPEILGERLRWGR